ncbi:bestrophin family protein [Taklimakanibacter deserti]|uniref:bestrophin family protein n=1 Tax=Taklimakanibacter deserti TaxID=2267839 RepID=UPI000E655954
MHVGKSYRAREFLSWSRRSLFALLIVSTASVLLYRLVGFKGLSLPWSVILLLGTTVTLVAAFKNTQTYSRSLEAQQAWSAISTSSRLWGALCRDFLNPEAARKLIYRHIAWLTALRFALRSPKPWETVDRKANAEFKRHYYVLEQETRLQDELTSSVSGEDAQTILGAANPAARALQLQGTDLKALLDQGALSVQSYLEMLKVLRELYDQQSRSERIKNFPYPRQYAVVSAMFVTIFCFLLPFGMIGQLAGLDAEIEGVMKGNMVWLVVPLSMLIGWMYASLDQVGESTSNPFEGGANDVPISQISRQIEIELRELLGENDLPAPLQPANGIVT